MTLLDKIKTVMASLLNETYKRRRVVLALACLVVFVTTYALILPALTLEKEKAAEQGGFIVTETEQAETASEQDEQADEPEFADAITHEVIEGTAFFADDEINEKPVTIPLYDYVVRRVAKSLNSISIAVQKALAQ